MFLGCCDYTNNGSSHVNAASKHDGPLDTTDESSFFGHNRNGELKSLVHFVFLDFLNKVPYSVLTGIISKIGSISNKLHLHTYSIMRHIYSLDKAEGSMALHLNFELLLVLRTQSTRYNVCFLEKCLYTCTCKSRPCNLIHLNLFFFSQMLTTSANISFPGYS